MARARNIKPGFFANEDLAECSPWARLCFAGLWTLADREGRLEDRPKRIKGELFRFDSVEVEALLAELVQHGFIVRYAPGFIQILKFREHQNPHFKEVPSVIPAPQEPESPGFDPHSMTPKPEALPPLMDDPSIQSQDKVGASPVKDGADPPFDGGKTGLIPDPGFLIPDPGSLIPDPREKTIAALRLVNRSAGAPADTPQKPPETGPPGNAQVQIPGTDPPPEPKAKPYVVPDCPYAELLDAYRTQLPMLPAVAILNGPRREHMRARWREVCAAERYDAEAGLEWFRWYFAHAATSKHLTGRGRPNRDTGRVWSATFDWLLLPTNFAKVVDGNYVDERVAT